MACALYMITNRKTGVRYVGISKTPKTRWRAHQKAARDGTGSPLYEAMRIDGADWFRFEVLFEYTTRHEAAEAERDLIAHLRLRHPEFGYNIATDGEGPPVTPETNDMRLREIEENIVRVAKLKGLDPDEMRSRIYAQSWDYIHGRGGSADVI